MAADRAGRRPDFLIAGHPKSGTTALYEMLRQHPEIYASPVKEPHYFAWDNPLPEGTGRRRWSSLDQTGVRAQTLEEYLALFAGARPGQRTGEGSTSYLWSPAAPARIAEVNPDARIIAIFREPAAFLRALHLQLVANRHEEELDFRTAVSLDDERRRGRRIPDRSVWPKALIYSDRVRYVEQLRRYEEFFPADQLLVLIYDDFRADNEATLQRVLRFLEVDATAPVRLVEANRAIRVRSPRVRDIVRRVSAPKDPVSRVVNATARVVVPAQVRRNVSREVLFGRPKPPDHRFMRELRRRFSDEVVALSEHLDRDLVGLWGYADLVRRPRLRAHS